MNPLPDWMWWCIGIAAVLIVGSFVLNLATLVLQTTMVSFLAYLAWFSRQPRSIHALVWVIGILSAVVAARYQLGLLPAVILFFASVIIVAILTPKQQSQSEPSKLDSE